MSGQHAILGPSSAERWVNCPASVSMSRDIPDTESAYAREGTLAHTLAELRARAALLGDEEGAAASYALWEEAMADEGLGEAEAAAMERHAEEWVALLRERLSEHPNSVLLLERQVETGIPGCWGTADAIIVSPTHVEAIDYKYGAGVPVSAVENPQVMLYGLGALRQYGDVIGYAELVRVTIFQPRLDSLSTYDVLPDELREWGDSLLEVADEALNSESPRFGPSEEACRWCPAKGVCRARMEASVVEDFGDPRQIDDEELRELLDRIPMMKAWIKDVEDAALHRAYSEGRPIPGYKVVRSGGRRSIVDDELAVKRLIDAGYLPEQVQAPLKARTLGDLEKLVGKDVLPDLLGDVLVKGEGKPSLAPADDPREAIDPDGEARRDFEVEE